MHCKDCRFWNQDGKPLFNYTRDTTEVPYEEWPHECMHPELKADVTAEGGDIWGAGTGIATAPDFGCIQFEALA